MLSNQGKLLIPQLIVTLHYDNTSMLYTAIFHGCKNENFQMKNCDVFSYFCLKH